MELLSVFFVFVQLNLIGRQSRASLKIRVLTDIKLLEFHFVQHVFETILFSCHSNTILPPSAPSSRLFEVVIPVDLVCIIKTNNLHSA